MPEAQTLEPPTLTTTTPTTPPPSNSTDVRDAAGTLKDQSAVATTTSTPTEPPKAPDVYTDFKLPDGLTFDTKALDSAKSMFKEFGLSQDAAQKLVDFQAQREVSLRDSNTKAMEDMRASWRDAAAKDPIIGPKLETDVREQVGKALSLLDPKVVSDFKDAMNLTGVGDNPAFIRAFYDLALKVNEGKHVSGTGPAAPGQRAPGTSERPSLAAALFPNLPR